MSPDSCPDLLTLVESLKTLPCWYVSCGGGAAGSTFQLAFGEKVSRAAPLKNPAHTEEFRRFEGEVNLLVWCTWRLDGPDRPLTSSDDSTGTIVKELHKLTGAHVESVSLAAPTWDLTIRFSNDLQLRLFCDHVPGDPSFDGNWECWGRQVVAFVGPGSHCTIEHRGHGREDASEKASPSCA